MTTNFYQVYCQLLTVERIKYLRPITTFIFLMAAFGVSASEEDTTNAKAVVKQAGSAELKLLQGSWEGVQVGDETKITMTITGNALHFHRDADFWFKTTITLPAGKDPKQFHATILECPPSQADSLGQVVKAFYQIENGTLTLATIGDDAEENAKGFAAAGTRYEFRKAQAFNKYLPLPKTK